MQARERAHCARSVFPFIKKKLLVTYVCMEFYLTGICVEESSGKPAQLTRRPKDFYSYVGLDGAYFILI